MEKVAAESDYHDYHNSYCNQFIDVQNLTHYKIADEIFDSTTVEKICIPIFYVIGFLRNVAFLLVLARVKTMRTITNFYLANLAVADVMTLSLETFARPWLYVGSMQVKSAPFYSNFGCAKVSFAIHLSQITSIFLITIVSFDRYFAICHPLKYPNTKIKIQAGCILTLLAWIISAILSFFRSLASGKLVHICILWPPSEKYTHLPGTVKDCIPINPFFRLDILEYLNHSVPFFTALITNTIINARIVQRLRSPSPGENGKQQNDQIKRRITWMLLANSLIFFSCLAPYNFLLVIGRFKSPKHNYYRDIAVIFTMLNSAINPILYGLTSPSYRRGFLTAFGLSRNQVEPTAGQETERTPAN